MDGSRVSARENEAKAIHRCSAGSAPAALYVAAGTRRLCAYFGPRNFPVTRAKIASDIDAAWPLIACIIQDGFRTNCYDGGCGRVGAAIDDSEAQSCF